MKNQKNNSWEKLEENWRNQLKNSSSQPSEELWSKIDHQLSKEDEPKLLIASKTPMKKYWTWAAIIALAIGLKWLNDINQVTELPKTTQSNGNSILVETPEKIHHEKILAKEDSKKRVQTTIHKLLISKEVAAVNEKKVEIEKTDLSQNLASTTQNNENSISQHEPEGTEEVWVKVSIDPIPTTVQLEKIAEAKPIEKKKKSFLKLIKQLKNIMNGENNLEDAPENITGSIHQVANTYYRTEEKFKQTFQ
ncbi:hypothetical protein V7S79_10840 [Aquirufa sp. ROCK-SH2]